MITDHARTRRTSAIDIFVNTLEEQEREIVRARIYLSSKDFAAIHGAESKAKKAVERIQYLGEIIDLDYAVLKRELQKRIPLNGHSYKQ